MSPCSALINTPLQRGVWIVLTHIGCGDRAFSSHLSLKFFKKGHRSRVIRIWTDVRVRRAAKPGESP